MPQTFQGPVSFDVAICDQRQRATNDPSVHASGDYVYVPVDLGEPVQGCGCGSTTPFVLFPALLWMVRRRSRR